MYDLVVVVGGVGGHHIPLDSISELIRVAKPGEILSSVVKSPVSSLFINESF